VQVLQVGQVREHLRVDRVEVVVRQVEHLEVGAALVLPGRPEVEELEVPESVPGEVQVDEVLQRAEHALRQLGDIVVAQVEPLEHVELLQERIGLHFHVDRRPVVVVRDDREVAQLPEPAERFPAQAVELARVDRQLPEIDERLERARAQRAEQVQLRVALDFQLDRVLRLYDTKIGLFQLGVHGPHTAVQGHLLFVGHGLRRDRLVAVRGHGQPLALVGRLVPERLAQRRRHDQQHRADEHRGGR